MSLDAAFNSLPEKETLFLSEIVSFLDESRPMMQLEYQKKFNMDEEDSKNYATKISSLALTLCRNYEVLLIKPSDAAEKLFTTMKDVAAAKNLRLAESTYDFWDELFNTINEAITSLEGLDHILRSYIEMIHISLVQSQKHPSLDYANIDPSEISEMENDLLGTTCVDFREVATGIFMRAYQLLQKAYHEKGVELFYK